MAAIDRVHWSVVTKQRYGIGPVEEGFVAEGVAKFYASAGQLHDHRAERACLQDSGLS